MLVYTVLFFTSVSLYVSIQYSSLPDFLFLPSFFLSLQSHIISQYLPSNYHSLTTDHDSIISSLLELSSSVQSQSTAPSRMITSLIYGPKGNLQCVCIYS